MSTRNTGNGTTDPSRLANVTLTDAGIALLKSLIGATSQQSEDCLTLNVWTKPQSGESKKAVLVWIHGGAYVSGKSLQYTRDAQLSFLRSNSRTTGGSSLSWYNGQALVEKEDVVLVSLK
jgi:carboxylesterase type B